MLRKYEWNMQDSQDTMKRPNLGIMPVDEGEELQLKALTTYSSEQLLKMSLTSRKKESSRYRKLTEQQTIRTKKKPSRHIVIKILTEQNKQRAQKLQKRKDKSHTKANQLE
jgi:hypothetical protein